MPIETQYHQSQALFQKLNELPPGTVLPIGSFHWRALYSSRHPVITYVNRDEKFLPLEEFMLIYGNYPYPSEHLSKIIECYKVTYIISDHAHLKHYKEQILKNPALFDQKIEILWEIPTLVIGRVHG
jgi:hypothetical protein